MRAASNTGRLNVSEQSNQQDVIGEMETNRQQKMARRLGMLQGADGRASELAIGRGSEGCLEEPEERTARCPAGENQRAFDTLAALGPVMRMIAAAPRALLAACCFTVDRRGMQLAPTTVRMVRTTAAHRQVNCQRRNAQDVRQCAHTTSCSFLLAIGDRVSLPLAEVV
jgi:hypothetical protein